MLECPELWYKGRVVWQLPANQRSQVSHWRTGPLNFLFQLAASLQAMFATQWQFFCLQLCAHFLWLTGCGPIVASSFQGRRQWTYQAPEFAQWNDFKAFTAVWAQLNIVLQLTDWSWIRFVRSNQGFCLGLRSFGGLIFLKSCSCLLTWCFGVGPAGQSRTIEFHRSRRCGWFALLSRRTQCPKTESSTRGRKLPPALRTY